MKSSKDGITTPFLVDHVLATEVVLPILSENNVPYIAIELEAQMDKQTCFDNHEKSLAYLKEKGLLEKK